MADVSELFLLPIEDDDNEDENSSQSEINFEAETLDPAAYWSSVFEEETLFPQTPPIFSPLHRSDDYGDDDDPHLDLSLDLSERCPPPETLDTSDFGDFDAVQSSMAPDYVGLGLGLGFDDHEEDEEEVHDCPMDQGEGLRVVGFDSESESDIDQNTSFILDTTLPLCWDSLRLEEERRELDEDFEWEEVDGRLDERDFLSMMVGEGSRSSELGEEVIEEMEGEARNVDWEVLLSVSNVVEDGDFINPSEYEVLFEQFADNDVAHRGTPPAAKLVVANLPSIVLTEEDVAKNNAICAVCKDNISLEEKVKQLPCLHHYHGDCISPWLGIRNTCPVCRYELLTDDAEYESWKAQRRASNEGSNANEVRYYIEMFSDSAL